MNVKIKICLIYIFYIGNILDFNKINNFFEFIKIITI